MTSHRRVLLLSGALMVLAGTAQAQVTVGVTISQTGPAAALGIPQKNSVAQLPKEAVWVVFEDVTAEDWYVGGTTVAALKKAGKL
jgi:hypothetical protein